MAFKMKNPSLMKMVKMAGNSRTAMKMKAEEAAMKLKKEAAMKLKKASAMKNEEGEYRTTSVAGEDYSYYGNVGPDGELMGQTEYER